MLRRGTTRTRLQAEAAILARARADPDTFLELTVTDPDGEPVRQADVHREMQAFLTAHPRALIELPRDHGKSVQVCGRIVWELGRNPALRVKLVCATDELAAQRSRYLRQMIANNRRVREVFPHLTPAYPWTAEVFTVARPAEVIGPSVAAFGVETGSTGARADLLVCDDVVDFRCLLDRGQRERVIESFHGNLMKWLERNGAKAGGH